MIGGQGRSVIRTGVTGNYEIVRAIIAVRYGEITQNMLVPFPTEKIPLGFVLDALKVTGVEKFPPGELDIIINEKIYAERFATEVLTDWITLAPYSLTIEPNDRCEFRFRIDPREIFAGTGAMTLILSGGKYRRT